MYTNTSSLSNDEAVYFYTNANYFDVDATLFLI